MKNNNLNRICVNLPVQQLYTGSSLDFVVPILHAATNIRFITVSTGTRSAVLFLLHSIDLKIPFPAAAMIPE